MKKGFLSTHPSFLGEAEHTCRKTWRCAGYILKQLDYILYKIYFHVKSLRIPTVYLENPSWIFLCVYYITPLLCKHFCFA